MKPFDPPEHGNIPPPPSGSDPRGVMILVLLAAVAFCGWYFTVRDSLTETDPLPVVRKPIMPPTTTNLSTDLPGHKHYLVIEPEPSQTPSRTTKTP